ncbi:MAG: zinc-dependent peptidase [Myxococcota bacterium]
MWRQHLFTLIWVLLGTLAAGLVGAALGRSWAWAGAAAAVAALAALWWTTRRLRRRAMLDREPFPEPWRRVLEEKVDYYQALDEADRRNFERQVRYFLDEHVVTGPRGAPLEDELRVLVAASAVILVFRRPAFSYPKLRDVIVYEDAFGKDYQVESHGTLLGQVGGQGPIILSAKALRKGFADPSDGHNVGLHEFAHVLDFDDGRSDGVPSFMPWRSIRPWIEVIGRETRRVQRRRSILRQYATKNEAEFFAVATEVFFEQPEALAEKHAELYALLCKTYGQDPARTDCLASDEG